MDIPFPNNLEADLVGTVVKPPSIRVSRSFRAISSNRSTPRGSPSLRRLSSLRTPRREPQGTALAGFRFPRFSTRRLLRWLILLAIWSYLGFYVLSRRSSVSDADHQDVLPHVLSDTLAAGRGRGSVFSAQNTVGKESKTGSSLQSSDQSVLLHLQPAFSLNRWAAGLWWPGSVGHSGHSNAESRAKTNRVDMSVTKVDQAKSESLEEGMNIINDVDLHSMKANETSKRMDNEKAFSSFHEQHQNNHQEGLQLLNITNFALKKDEASVIARKLVGPFDDLENEVLQLWKGMKPNKCTHKNSFLRAAQGKYFVVVIHELSMTGAPLAMIELASEVLSCGGKVAAVVLSRKGGLLSELLKRKIPIVKDKAVRSWKEAAKADLIVAGSAVCAGWIDSFLAFHKDGAKYVVWWLMENRREYFDRSKNVLGLVSAVVFLSKIQLQQWQQWCDLEGLILPSKVSVIALSVNEGILLAAGLRDTFESQNGNYADFDKKRQKLRYEVRRDMRVEQNDYLFVSLSSINPGKGQLLTLEAASLVAEGHSHSLQGHSSLGEAADLEADINGHDLSRIKALSRNFLNSNEISSFSATVKRANQLLPNLRKEEFFNKDRNDPDFVNSCQRQFGNCSMKILIGSVGSKSNKVEYVQRLMDFLTEHPLLATSTLWTPASVHTISLYIAADAYIMNAQGIGETFGRVTIEAMAFGLPVLGTDAGGTREVVIANVTGLLHPVGKTGVSVLAKHMDFLLSNPHIGREMGERGKERVQNLYIKSIMYEKLATIFLSCFESSHA